MRQWFGRWLTLATLSCPTANGQDRALADSAIQQAYLKASDAAPRKLFGWSVAVSGDTVVVGARDSFKGPGAVYVYVNRSGVWSQQARLEASNKEAADRFGYSVAISGDTLVVGAPGESSAATGVDGNQADNSALASGAAYVFERRAGVWSQKAYLKASNPGIGDGFGTSVGVSGATLVVGAPGESGPTDSDAMAGAAYVFERSATSWSQQAFLKGSNTGTLDNFGQAVAISKATIVVGAVLESSAATGVDGNEADNSACYAGAAYVFTRSGGIWDQQAYLKASNTGMEDFFGSSVAVSGDIAIIGATGEDSAATGINGSEGDNSTSFAGAAYLFERRDGVWSQGAYLKASNTERADLFGGSVAVSGETVVIGAFSASAPAGEVDGKQAVNESGAAYAFSKIGGRWTHRADLRASNADLGDSFGDSVAIDRTTVVIGASHEDGDARGVNKEESGRPVFESGAAYVYRLPATPLLTIVKAPAPFDATRIGSSRKQRLVLWNTGTEPIRGLRLRVSGEAGREFKIRGRVPKLLAPGRMSRSEVVFRPTRSGSRMATLFISGDFGTTKVPLSGEGQPTSPRYPIGR